MKRTPPSFGQIFFALSLVLFVTLAVLSVQNRQKLFNSGTEGSAVESSEPATPPAESPTPTTSPSPTEALSLDEDSEGDEQATPTPTKPPTNDEQQQSVESSEDVSITITRAAIEDETLVVRTTISTTEPGTCSMIVGLSDDSFYTAPTVETTPFNGSSTCEGFNIPFSEFGAAAGVSDVEVTYQNSEGVTVTTGPQSYEIFLDQ